VKSRTFSAADVAHDGRRLGMHARVHRAMSKCEASLPLLACYPLHRWMAATPARRMKTVASILILPRSRPASSLLSMLERLLCGMLLADYGRGKAQPAGAPTSCPAVVASFLRFRARAHLVCQAGGLHGCARLLHIQPSCDWEIIWRYDKLNDRNGPNEAQATLDKPSRLIATCWQAIHWEDLPRR
jgi:hypothetical protein